MSLSKTIIRYRRLCAQCVGCIFKLLRAQVKPVRCSRGAIFDAVADIRRGSRTFDQLIATLF